MRFIRQFFPLFCIVAVPLFAVCCAAETTTQKPAKGSVTTLPPAAEVSSPFDLNASASARLNSIDMLPADAMSAEDRQAAVDARPVIERKAALAGFDLGQGQWSYQQIECPALPEHMLLLFAQTNGPGDRSMFSAAVTRQGEKTVRIVPILRRSYGLFSPAPANPVTIAAFNQIRAHDQAGKKVDWLTTGLCYAAMSGHHVALAAPAASPAQGAFQLAMDPLIQIGEDGGATVTFMDVEAPQRPNLWEMTFDQQGKLLKVTVSAVPTPAVQTLPAVPVPAVQMLPSSETIVPAPATGR